MAGFSTANVKNAHLNYLDALRGVAILLVICRHWHVSDLLTNSGWLGVDLFFVISGFLITGLLFSEYEKKGEIDFTRFFLRRGLKIYPLFLLLILATFIVMRFTSPVVHINAFLKEVLFIQNYRGGVYLHTWSLAIEEHFYLLLILCFALFIKHISKLSWVFLFFMAAPLLFRLWKVAGNDLTNHFFTHTRIDSLFTGSLLCYLWRYNKEKLLLLPNAARYSMLLLCLACLSIFGFVEPETAFVQGVGFTLIAFCFAGILLFALTAKTSSNPAAKPFAFIGFYSYSIYLLHIPVKYVLEYFNVSEGEGLRNILYFLLYTFLAVLSGVAFSELIEQPILRWRNKRLPSKA